DIAAGLTRVVVVLSEAVEFEVGCDAHAQPHTVAFEHERDAGPPPMGDDRALIALTAQLHDQQRRGLEEYGADRLTEVPVVERAAVKRERPAHAALRGADVVGAEAQEPVVAGRNRIARRDGKRRVHALGLWMRGDRELIAILKAEIERGKSPVQRLPSPA